MTKNKIQNRSLGCFTCALVFGCWDLGGESRHAEKERSACKAEQIHKLTTILTENNNPGPFFWQICSCQPVNLFSFASSSFFLSMRKIT